MTGNQQLDLSAVLPVFNEAESIAATVRELDGVLAGLADTSYEIVAVDDASTDGTLAALRDLGATVRSLRAFTLAPHGGQSAALWAGFRAARGRTLVTLDADGQNDPASIPALLAALRDCDCVCGYREWRQDSPTRRLASFLANGIRNRALGEDIIDTGCSLKAFKAALAEGLPPWDGMHRFIPSYFLMQGARLRQVPTRHRPRRAGRSKYTNLGRLGRTFADLRAMCWLKRRYRRVRVEAVP